MKTDDALFKPLQWPSLKGSILTPFRFCDTMKSFHSTSESTHTTALPLPSLKSHLPRAPPNHALQRLQPGSAVTVKGQLEIAVSFVFIQSEK